MKYKYLKDQNKSFKKQIDEQNKLIKNQTILIDKLTNEKIDLLSKLEIKNINYKKFKKPIDALRLEIKFTPYIKDIINTLNSKTAKVVVDNRRIYTNSEKTRIIDELDIVAEENTSDLWEKVKSRIIPYGNHTTIFSYNEQKQIELNHKLNKLFYSEKTIRNQNVWEKLELATENNVFAIKKLTDYIDKEKLFKFTKPKKQKDWYQKHNNKQRFQGKNK